MSGLPIADEALDAGVENHGGGATEPVRREPNFFIVGAPRAGTTTLWYMLRQHPDVFMPRHKEPYYYCDAQPPFAIKGRDQYLDLFASARRETAIGEASAGYLAGAGVPERLRTNHPDARIIIMLRDPVERAYSMYRLNCSLGYEWLSSFEQAIEAEPRRQKDERFKAANPYFFEAYRYFWTGLVAEGLQRYVNAFRPEQIRIIFFEDFKKDSLRATQETFAFLGVDPDFEPDPEPQNVSAFPFWVRGHHAIRNRLGDSVGSSRSTRLTGPERWLTFAWSVNLLLGEAMRTSGVAPKTRRRLVERFADDIHATARLTGRNLEAWLR